MIIVNINRLGARAVTEQQIQEATVGYWVVSEVSELAFGDNLLAVRKNLVVGAWTVQGSSRDKDGKVRFDVGPAPKLADMIGHESPALWKQGQANPVKLSTPTPCAKKRARWS